MTHKDFAEKDKFRITYAEDSRTATLRRWNGDVIRTFTSEHPVYDAGSHCCFEVATTYSYVHYDLEACYKLADEKRALGITKSRKPQSRKR